MEAKDKKKSKVAFWQRRHFVMGMSTLASLAATNALAGLALTGGPVVGMLAGGATFMGLGGTIGTALAWAINPSDRSNDEKYKPTFADAKIALSLSSAVGLITAGQLLVGASLAAFATIPGAAGVVAGIVPLVGLGAWIGGTVKLFTGMGKDGDDSPISEVVAEKFQAVKNFFSRNDKEPEAIDDHRHGPKNVARNESKESYDDFVRFGVFGKMVAANEKETLSVRDPGLGKASLTAYMKAFDKTPQRIDLLPENLAEKTKLRGAFAAACHFDDEEYAMQPK